MKSRQLRRNKVLRRNKTKKRGGGPLLETSADPYNTALEFVKSKLAIIRKCKSNDDVIANLPTLISKDDLIQLRGDDWVINGVWAAISTDYLIKGKTDDLDIILTRLKQGTPSDKSIARSIDSATIGFRVASLPPIP